MEASAYFNPLAPTGHYEIDMSNPGDRDILTAILGLDKVCIQKHACLGGNASICVGRSVYMGETF